MASPDQVRASDAERDAVLDRLRQALVEGRLDQSEFDDRAGLALRARTVGELVPVTEDLPVGPSRPLAPVGGAPRSPAGTIPEAVLHRWTAGRAALFGGWFPIFVISTIVWAMTSGVDGGWAGFWPKWVLLWGAVSIVGVLRGHSHGDRGHDRHRDRDRRDRLER